MSQKFRPKEPVEASGIDVAKRIWTHWACGDYFWFLVPNIGYLVPDLVFGTSSDFGVVVPGYWYHATEF